MRVPPCGNFRRIPGEADRAVPEEPALPLSGRVCYSEE
ncbi:MAG: hypothetical protein BLITH_1009 [Brockia lithotrophica]|uniref:Uncharacterized protein n=1 Tax=Brockia lithotrophica TaxID=933949 RepID=A0A2T5G797_9BACL|nr:MAG: hypothetical protein BLITH_1009 [Brockia lithotrophica]